MNVRIDVVAKAYLEHLTGVAVSDDDWMAMETDDEGHALIEACREAAREAVIVADHVAGTVH